MALGWSHVRLRIDTHRKLMAMVDRLDETAAKGHMERWWRGDQGPTTDELIAKLIDHVEHDRKRAAASRKRRKAEMDKELMDGSYELA